METWLSWDGHVNALQINALQIGNPVLPIFPQYFLHIFRLFIILHIFRLFKYFYPKGPTLAKHVVKKVASVYFPPCNFCYFQLLLIVTKTLKTHRNLTISYWSPKHQSAHKMSNIFPMSRTYYTSSLHPTDSHTLQPFPTQQLRHQIFQTQPHWSFFVSFRGSTDYDFNLWGQHVSAQKQTARNIWNSHDQSQKMRSFFEANGRKIFSQQGEKLVF